VSTLTTANQLTLLRMLLIPAFVILTLYNHDAWALGVFVLAGVTDGLDGWVARRGQKTSLGAFLDPMADKLLLVSTFVVLTIPGIGLVNRIPLWLTILVISRDVVIVLTVAIASIAVGRRQFTPSVYGKVATAVYIVFCVVVMFFNAIERRSVLVTVGVYVTLAATLVSGIHYIAHAARIINQPPAVSQR
jgi:cardiolipin synthase